MECVCNMQGWRCRLRFSPSKMSRFLTNQNSDYYILHEQFVITPYYYHLVHVVHFSGQGVFSMIFRDKKF